jgi:cytochrome c oxidase subunit 2
MQRGRTGQQRRGRRTVSTMVATLTVAAGAIALAACGGSDAEPPLSPLAAQGKQLAVNKGCAACHQFYGKNTAGPTWKGLYGSEVELDDGTTVVADEAYLTRSIKDPWSQKVDGYGTVMPRNSLTDEEVALIVGYIKELNPAATG